MCGVVGLVTKEPLRRDRLSFGMRSLRHRGPDGVGAYDDGDISLGHCRLSIIDIANGQQPVTNEDGTVVVIFNGEIYNYRELATDLVRKGHQFNRESDASLLPHLYEAYGTEMFRVLDGQFAIAVWDKRSKQLLLGRDRMGEKPLYYFQGPGVFGFASEIKALFASRYIQPAISADAISRLFTYRSLIGSQSAFEHVSVLPEGSYLIYQGGAAEIHRYWWPEFAAEVMISDLSEERALRELEERLVDAVRSRMIADVPVSFYISGGLDSSLILGIAAKEGRQPLHTFSISFEDGRFDESDYQRLLADYYGTTHRTIRFQADTIPDILREVIYHTEEPFLRTAVFPMYQLAAAVKAAGIKVALAGEGADELFAGYDIHRESRIKDLYERAPGHAYIRALAQAVPAVPSDLSHVPVDPVYGTHLSRWKAGLDKHSLFTADFRSRMTGADATLLAELAPPGRLAAWSRLQRAQYIDLQTLMGSYHLSVQGDRVGMASGVECRYPYLAPGVIDLALSLTDGQRMRGLQGKYLLRRLAAKYVPEAVLKRKKFVYRAPMNVQRLMDNEYVKGLLSTDKMEQFGIFDPLRTTAFLQATASNSSVHNRELMFFLGVLTTQALYDAFVNQDDSEKGVFPGATSARIPH